MPMVQSHGSADFAVGILEARVNRLTVHVGTTCGYTFAASRSISAECYGMLRSEWWEMDAGLLPRAAWCHF